MMHLTVILSDCRFAHAAAVGFYKSHLCLKLKLRRVPISAARDSLPAPVQHLVAAQGPSFQPKHNGSHQCAFPLLTSEQRNLAVWNGSFIHKGNRQSAEQSHWMQITAAEYYSNNEWVLNISAAECNSLWNLQIHTINQTLWYVFFSF